MKIKKLIASILVVVIALTVFTSFGVSAQGYKLGKGLTYASAVSADFNSQIIQASDKDFEITLTVAEVEDTNEYTKNDVAEPARPIEIVISINNVEDKAILDSDKNIATFSFKKFDKIDNIIISTSRDIIITDYSVNVIKSLAAGAPIYEAATPIVRR